MLKWYQWYVIGRFCNLFCLLHCRNWKSMALMSVCNCVISVKKCFLSPNNGFLRFCQGKTQIPIKNYILNSTNRITTVLCQKCLTQQAHIIRASTLHPSSTILLLSYIFLCEQKKKIPRSSIVVCSPRLSDCDPSGDWKCIELMYNFFSLISPYTKFTLYLLAKYNIFDVAL